MKCKYLIKIVTVTDALNGSLDEKYKEKKRKFELPGLAGKIYKSSDTCFSVNLFYKNVIILKKKII